MLKSKNSTLKILVVEDDESTLKAVLLKLKKSDMEADFATDGVQGIKKLEQNPNEYDAVLLDIHMPQGDGFGFLEEKAKRENLAHVPVIVFTNMGQAEFVKRAITLGAKGYLLKAHHGINEIIDELKKCITGGQCKIDY